MVTVRWGSTVQEEFTLLQIRTGKRADRLEKGGTVATRRLDWLVGNDQKRGGDPQVCQKLGYHRNRLTVVVVQKDPRSGGSGRERRFQMKPKGVITSTLGVFGWDKEGKKVTILHRASTLGPYV